MVKSELRQLQLLDINNIQVQARNFSEKDFENYLVNFFCYSNERIVAAFSRFGNVYKVYLRNKNKIKDRQEKLKEFKNFVKAKEYLIKILANCQKY